MATARRNDRKRPARVDYQRILVRIGLKIAVETSAPHPSRTQSRIDQLIREVKQARAVAEAARRINLENLFRSYRPANQTLANVSLALRSLLSAGRGSRCSRGGNIACLYGRTRYSAALDAASSHQKAISNRKPGKILSLNDVPTRRVSRGSLFKTKALPTNARLPRPTVRSRTVTAFTSHPGSRFLAGQASGPVRDASPLLWPAGRSCAPGLLR